MQTASTDINLRIALTLLQFVALAFPAIYIFLQIVDNMESTTYIENMNKYHIARSSVITFVIASFLLLVTIGANMQGFPLGTVFTQSNESWILTIAVVLTALGILQFGFSIIVRLLQIDPGISAITTAYWKTCSDIRSRLRD